MNKKQVYENQESLLKIMQENVELKKQIKKLREHLTFEYYDNGIEIPICEIIEDLDKILIGDKNE